MSKLLIFNYYKEIDQSIKYKSSHKKSFIKVAFQKLLNNYCQTRDFLLIPELDYTTKSGQIICPDGTIKDTLRLDWGYWESKTPTLKGGIQGDLDQEIEQKLELGYPDDNILFEDSQTAVLIQNGQETMRVSVRNSEDLDQIIKTFINYTRPEVRDFWKAIDSFKEDLPTILSTLRELIDLMLGGQKSNFSPQLNLASEFTAKKSDFLPKFNALLKLCQESINPNINSEDIREIMIQHILTEDIFLHIFNESKFHQENNIFRSLQGVIDTFFTEKIKRQTLSSIDRYYNVIRRTAANIINYHEKQKFLKAIYENFYKAYNPLVADRLGIVYTPNEIVKFMIESTDYLVHKHFNKVLADSQVEILDPATGTGTFITELIEYLPKDKVKSKYQNEIHCHELAILSYYIAHLNIEYTYTQKMGEYEQFNNIYLVDTLDHIFFEQKHSDLLSKYLENTEKLKGKNDNIISVIIGNPPYNANQKNENDNNKNRQYSAIDKRIKDTYIKESTAQKTKVYDLYSRFFRWATDRLNDNGIIAFITNSSFIKARSFDGFRKNVVKEFDYIYIIDLGGDIRSGDKTGNVFNIMVGVAITFLVKKSSQNKLPCQIMYFSPQNVNSGQEKLDFLATNKFDSLNFQYIIPDPQNNWINLTDNDFDSLLTLANKETKLAKKISDQKSVFKLYSLGLATNRDEWVYDFNYINLTNKIKYFCNSYKKEQQRWFSSDKKIQINDFVERKIKWTSELEQHLIKGSFLNFQEGLIIKSIYRPFVSKNLYFDRIIVHRMYQQDLFFPIGKNKNNIIIAISGISSNKNFQCLATKTIIGLDFLEKTQCLPLYTYNKEGNQQENITDWGLQQFRDYYTVGANGCSPLQELITKLDIFYYIYGVLHNPKYREKYQLNLKREFPKIPFYNDFNQWKTWGQKLMDMHLNYETIKPYPLKRIDPPLTSSLKGGGKNIPLIKGGRRRDQSPKPKLKADKTKGQIIIDEITTLTEIPPEVWEYKLGNRSALEWILDQYKEKKPRDQTIAQKFNNYRFSDYKEQVIDLLKRITTVSVETMNIIKKMEKTNQ